MLSSNVTRAETHSRAVESFLASHGAAVRQGVDERAAHLVAQGQPPPATEGLTTLLDNLLREARERLTAADREHEGAAARAVDQRRQRDEALSRLRTTLIRIKSLVEGTFGRHGLDEVLGLDDPVVSEDAVTLSRQVGTVLDTLRSPDLALPPPLLSFSTFDPQAVATALANDLGALQTALAQVAAGRRILERLRLHRRACQRDLNRLVSHSTGLLDYLARLGGRQELIRPLRQEVRRRRGARRRAEPAESAPEEAGSEFRPTTGGEAAGGSRSAPETHLAPLDPAGLEPETHLAPSGANHSAPKNHLAPSETGRPERPVRVDFSVPNGCKGAVAALQKAGSRCKRRRRLLQRTESKVLLRAEARRGNTVGSKPKENGARPRESGAPARAAPVEEGN